MGAFEYLPDPRSGKAKLGLSGLVVITSTRGHKGETSTEKRYYLTNHAPEAELLGILVRRHWGIDNRCHWVLDVTSTKTNAASAKAMR